VTASVTDYLSRSAAQSRREQLRGLRPEPSRRQPDRGLAVDLHAALLDSLTRTRSGRGDRVPFSSSGGDQRGALNLSPDGSTLYVDWACYAPATPLDDDRRDRVTTGSPTPAAGDRERLFVRRHHRHQCQRRMWGAGGPTVDARATSSSHGRLAGRNREPGWRRGQLRPGIRPGQTLKLTGVYSP